MQGPVPYSWRPKVGLTLTYGSLFVKTVYHSQAELQALFATICDNDKGIWVGVGPLPSLVYQLFGLVGVGPYRPSGTELDYQAQPEPQALN